MLKSCFSVSLRVVIGLSWQALSHLLTMYLLLLKDESNLLRLETFQNKYFISIQER